MSIKYKCNDCGNEFYYYKGNWVPVYCPICGKTNINIIDDINYDIAFSPFYRDSVGTEGLHEDTR